MAGVRDETESAARLVARPPAAMRSIRPRLEAGDEEKVDYLDGIRLDCYADGSAARSERQ